MFERWTCIGNATASLRERERESQTGLDLRVMYVLGSKCTSMLLQCT